MKYLGIVSIFTGIYVNLAFFTQLFETVFDPLFPVILIGFAGIGVAILGLKENKGSYQRCVSSVGLLVNLLPLMSFLYLWIGAR